MKNFSLETKFVSIKECRHGLLGFYKTDKTIGKSLDHYGEWCEKELTVIGRFLKRGDCALDVGANIGTHTLFFSKKVGVSGRVLAFEPQSLARRLLNFNIAINDIFNIKVYPNGVSNKFGVQRLYEDKPGVTRNFGLFSLETSALKGEPFIENDVEIITVDSLNLERCDFIKIDVEGMEKNVLEGSCDTILRFKPILWVENNTIDYSADILKFMLDKDYKVYWHFDSRFNYKNYYRNKNNIFENVTKPSSNVLALPSDYSIDNELFRDLGLIPVLSSDENWKSVFNRICI